MVLSLDFDPIDKNLDTWQTSEAKMSYYQFYHRGERITVAIFKERAYHGASAAITIKPFPFILCIVSLDNEIYKQFEIHFKKETGTKQCKEIYSYKDLRFTIKFFKDVDEMNGILDKEYSSYEKYKNPLPKQTCIIF